MINDELHVVHARAAGLDIHKKQITAGVRICQPGETLQPALMKGRIARFTVLTWNAPDGQIHNIFTLIRHRREETLGPWFTKPRETWSSEKLDHNLTLITYDTYFEHCQSFLDQILESGVLIIDGHKVTYNLDLVPRHHWAYRDDRPESKASIRSPFSHHSAQITEYWSFKQEPRKHWENVLESHVAKIPPDMSRLGFPLSRRLDRVGNLVIAGAEDEITCNFSAHHDHILRFDVDANELLPGFYRATVWARYCGNEILRREIPVSSDQTVIQLESEVDNIGFSIHRTSDGQYIDLMEVNFIMEVNIKLNIESGPTLNLQKRKGRHVNYKVNPPPELSFLNIQDDNHRDETDKNIRQQWLKHQNHEYETIARREDKVVRFQPSEFQEAYYHLINLLRPASDEKGAVYLADPYLRIDRADEKLKQLYIDLFNATSSRPLRILCCQEIDEQMLRPWKNIPQLRIDHVSIRSFRNKTDANPKKHGFHDRFLITPRREIIFTNSINSWKKNGVTFVSTPYQVYRTEAERLWSLNHDSNSTDLIVREID